MLSDNDVVQQWRGIMINTSGESPEVDPWVHSIMNDDMAMRALDIPVLWGANTPLVCTRPPEPPLGPSPI